LYIHSIDLAALTVLITVLVTVLVAILTVFSVIVLLIRPSTDDDKAHKKLSKSEHCVVEQQQGA